MFSLVCEAEGKSRNTTGNMIISPGTCISRGSCNLQFGKGLPALHDHGFSFSYRCARVLKFSYDVPLAPGMFHTNLNRIGNVVIKNKPKIFSC